MVTLIRLTAIAALVLLLTPPVYAEPRPPRIGFLLPLSGYWAFLGNGIRNGAVLAQQDVEKRGQSVELIFEDGKGELSESAKVAAKLIAHDRVDAVVSIFSGVGAVLKPMAKRAHIVHIGICSDPAVADGEYNFINYLVAQDAVDRYIAYFDSSVGSNKKLAVFQVDEAGFERLSSELYGRKTSISLLPRITFDSKNSDLSTTILRTARLQPDAILLLALSPQLELLAEQWKQLRPNIPITSIEGFGLAAKKQTLEGGWFVDSAVPSADFQDRYEKTYKSEVTPGAGHAYDSVLLLLHDYQDVNGRESHAQRLRSTGKYQGVTGELTVQANGIIRSPASIKIIKNGRAEAIAR